MQQVKKRVTHQELLSMGLLPWNSWKTTKRKITAEEFPAYQQSVGRWSFDPKEVEMWFKKRKVLGIG